MVLGSNLTTIHGSAANTRTAFENISFCLPTHGYAVVRLSTPVVASIPGDLRNEGDASLTNRKGGLFVPDVALSDDVGGACKA